MVNFTIIRCNIVTFFWPDFKHTDSYISVQWYSSHRKCLSMEIKCSQSKNQPYAANELVWILYTFKNGKVIDSAGMIQTDSITHQIKHVHKTFSIGYSLMLLAK